MIWPRLVYLLAIFPAFYLVTTQLTATVFLLSVTLLGALNAFSNGAALICVSEGIPKRVRSAALAVVYALGIAIFGGLTQPVVAWLLHVTGNAMAPAYCLIGATRPLHRRHGPDEGDHPLGPAPQGARLRLGQARRPRQG